MDQPPRVCAVCRSKATQMCGGCGEISYCNRQHQKQHWSVHKAQCKPYKIAQDEKFGRYLVATKNLKAGDVIFRERAVMTGPKQGCRPLCLTCYTGLDRVEESDLFRCPGCNFPFCQERCAKSPGHVEAECAVLGRAKSRTSIKDMSQTHPVYQCISPLRALLLKTTQPKSYETFSGLQHHNELRRQTDLWRVYQVNIVDFLRNVCGLADQFSAEDIHAACGALDVNAFEIRLPANGQRVLGAFLLASMMAHRCVSNISHVIDSNYQMTVRASVPIQRGEAIFGSYASSLDGTKDRRAQLRLSKFFECDCFRCSDPTECSTMMSSLRCQACPTGIVLPVDPLDEQKTQWRCHQCPYTLTATVVNRTVDKLQQQFDTIGSNQVDKFEGFLKRHVGLLHPNHFLFTSAKHSLSQLYGRDECYLLNTLSSEQLERKISICRDVLAIADVIEPGLARLRGVTLYEMHAPMLLLARRSFEAGHLPTKELKEKIEHVRLILSEATKILSLEDASSAEGSMAMASVQALDQIQRWLSSL